jgi:CheY-like chemotaxis protein
MEGCQIGTEAACENLGRSVVIGPAGSRARGGGSSAQTGLGTPSAHGSRRDGGLLLLLVLVVPGVTTPQAPNGTGGARGSPKRVLLLHADAVMAEPELEVEARVADDAALVAMAETAKPDVIVTDIVMPHKSGIEATAELRPRHPEMRVVLVTVHDEPGLVERGIAAGALGHVLKVAAAHDLVPAVQRAVRLLTAPRAPVGTVARGRRIRIPDNQRIGTREVS